MNLSVLCQGDNHIDNHIIKYEQKTKVRKRRVYGLISGRGTKDRTRDTRFWRPLLYQLSYTPRNGGPSGTRTPGRPVMSRLL